MDKKIFREILCCDKKVFEQYIQEFRSKLLLQITNDHIILIRKYIVLLRYCQYYKEKYEAGNKVAIMPYILYAKRMNALGNKLGFYISPSAKIGKGFWIYHHGAVIINGNVRIGDFCRLHGSNCIGNGGVNNHGAPLIGNNCDIGFGAVIIGNVTISDNTTVGANAVVNKNFNEPNVILAGVPAIMKGKNNEVKHCCTNI